MDGAGRRVRRRGGQAPRVGVERLCSDWASESKPGDDEQWAGKKEGKLINYALQLV